eukprot:174754-Amorphochlora_amoeboformis.AAC.1
MRNISERNSNKIQNLIIESSRAKINQKLRNSIPLVRHLRACARRGFHSDHCVNSVFPSGILQEFFAGGTRE